MKIGRIERIAVLTVGAGLATLIACGSDGSSDFASPSANDGGSSSGSSGPSFGDGGATAPARGVVLVHAAAFPSMRLCFSNYPDIAPQPDRKVLPQANVVGVDLGGLVRLGPMLTPPGKVFVIPQAKAAAVPGAPELTCAAYLKTHDEDVDWYHAGEINEPVGVTHAEVLAITGCGPRPYLTNQLKIDPADSCPGFDAKAESAGTFATTRLTLTETTTATPQTLPMTLVDMSPLLKKRLPPGQTLDVTFGDLDAGATAKLATPIPVSSDDSQLYKENASVTLDLNQQNNEAVYGRSGFRIAYRDSTGAAGAPDAGGMVVDQTLAQIQASSRSDGNPTSYYVASSNFAFFLLGDPRMTPTFVDGGANPNFDARRAVHLLAVPVRDDSEATPLGDAGAPADSGADAGDAGR